MHADASGDALEPIRPNAGGLGRAALCAPRRLAVTLPRALHAHAIGLALRPRFDGHANLIAAHCFTKNQVYLWWLRSRRTAPSRNMLVSTFDAHFPIAASMSRVRAP